MTKQEYENYERRFREFIEREGLNNLSASRYKCPDCGEPFACSACPRCGKDGGEFPVEPYSPSAPTAATRPESGCTSKGVACQAWTKGWGWVANETPLDCVTCQDRNMR